LLLWVACDSFEFEKACCVFRYYFPDPCAFYARSYYTPLWCDLCNTSAHNVSSCPYYAYYAHSDSSLPLTQCTGLDVGEPIRFDASLGMNNVLYRFEDTLDREHNLVNTPLKGCREVFVHERSSNLTCDNVIPNSLEQSYVFTMCSQPSSFSPENIYDVPIDNFEICDPKVDMGHAGNMFNVLGGNEESFESLGSLRGYDVALDQYCIELKDKPRKIMEHYL